MRFAPGGPIVPVQWFFTAPGALLLGKPTVFYSRNWEDAAEKFDELGERPGPRRWVSGLRKAFLDGQRFCSPPDFLDVGLPRGKTLDRIITLDGVPLCCLPRSPAIYFSSGFSSRLSVTWNAGGGVGLEGVDVTHWKVTEKWPPNMLDAFVILGAGEWEPFP